MFYTGPGLVVDYLSVGLGTFRLFFKLFRFVLERGPSARLFHSCSFFQSFSFFNNRFNILKNAFYAFFFFFGTMGSFLIVPFVLVKERSFPRNDAQPYLSANIAGLYSTSVVNIWQKDLLKDLCTLWLYFSCNQVHMYSMYLNTSIRNASR